MIIKSLEPEKDLDLCQILWFKTQRLVLTHTSMDRSTHEHIVVAKYADGKAYVIHNFGKQAMRANRACKHLNNLYSAVCGLGSWQSGIKSEPQTA